MTDKQEPDSLRRFLFEQSLVRGEFIHLQESFLTIIEQHNYPPAIRRLLGEALCVAGLLSAIIKFDGRLTIQFRGQGKLKLLLAQCDNQFHIRGLVKWEDDLSYEDLMGTLNDGVLMIMLDGGPSKRYQGVVAWRGNSLAESVEGYFRDSEQLATRIWLAVDDSQAAGLLLQIIPSKEKISDLQEEIIHPHWESITKQADHLKSDDLLYIDYEKLLRALFPQEMIRVFSAVSVMFQCTCSRKKSADAIALLGRKEAEEEIADKQIILVTCDFCNKEYSFDRVDVAKIFDDQDRGASSHHLH